MIPPPAPRDPVVLVVNERAGHGRGARAGSQAHEALASRGARVERMTTKGPGDASLLARAARDRGAAVVAAVGGDGTLHEVLNGLLGDTAGVRVDSPPAPLRDRPSPLLGVIPVGSGNDYVKMLGISRTDPRRAATVLLDGEAFPVDVGLLEGAAPLDAAGAAPELFLNNLGLAFAGVANARIESTRGLPGGLAYFVGAALAFLAYDAERYTVTVDGQTLAGHPRLVHVNLGRYCGGGVVFTPDALLDDGLFDVLVVGELSRLECAVRWHGLTTGKARHMPDVGILRGHHVSIEGPPGALLHADGEVRRFAGPVVTARVLPRAISVLRARGMAGEPAPWTSLY